MPLRPSRAFLLVMLIGGCDQADNSPSGFPQNQVATPGAQGPSLREEYTSRDALRGDLAHVIESGPENASTQIGLFNTRTKGIWADEIIEFIRERKGQAFTKHLLDWLHSAVSLEAKTGVEHLIRMSATQEPQCLVDVLRDRCPEHRRLGLHMAMVAQASDARELLGLIDCLACEDDVQVKEVAYDLAEVVNRAGEWGGLQVPISDIPVVVRTIREVREHSDLVRIVFDQGYLEGCMLRCLRWLRYDEPMTDIFAYSALYAIFNGDPLLVEYIRGRNKEEIIALLSQGYYTFFRGQFALRLAY